MIGASLRQDQIVLEWYWKSLLRLRIPDDMSVEYVFVDDSDGEIDWTNLPDASIIPSDPRPPDANYEVTDVSHKWSLGAFDHLAKQKQKLIQYAIDNHFDYFFLVDSDLLLEPTTLMSLISLDSPIASAVFWTQWEPSAPPIPQVWLKNPYEMQGIGMEAHEFLRALAERQAIRVIGGGACCLFDVRVFSHCRYFPRFKNLPNSGMWQGEDRTMAITCQQSHIDQFADAWPSIYHAYHPKMRTADALQDAFEYLQAPRQLFANYGDLVSFELEALDMSIPAGANQAIALQFENTRKQLLDPRIKLVRGRLGGLKIAPEIEDAIFEMSPHQSRIIDIKFPFYADLPDYRNKTKLYKLKLHDIKPFGFAPILNEAIL